MKNASYDVLVVGGGAAGMMAAYTAAKEGAQVLLLEKMPRLGRKMLITGKGRCNVTNHIAPRDFLEHVPRNPRFLYSALFQFSPDDVWNLLEEAGLPLKVERGNRVFPQSDRAMDVVDTFVRLVHKAGANVRENSPVFRLLGKERVEGVELANGERLWASCVILCTGGLSYPRTGSTGDGYRMAEEMGHHVTVLCPSLVRMACREKAFCQSAQGLGLKNVILTVQVGEKEVFSELGELLFTDDGISGPLTLSASAHLTQKVLPNTRFWIDLKPGLSAEKLDERLLRDFAETPNRDFLNSLHKLLPKSLVAPLVEKSGIPKDKKVNQIKKEERQRFVNLLKAVPLTPVAFGPMEEAIVTSGGVEVKEIDPKTMQSKRVQGLYLAGELLDVDGYTGGFNLQIAFSTGFLAGRSAAMQAKERVE